MLLQSVALPWYLWAISVGWTLSLSRESFGSLATSRKILPSNQTSYSRGSRDHKLGDHSDISSFVTAPGDGHLYLKGKLFDFRGFNVPSLWQSNGFEVQDLLKTIAGFGSPVTRTYTLQIANNMFEGGLTTPSEAHIIGWNDVTKNWRYNETVWRHMDAILNFSRKYGVKLIIPIINQDYGMSDTDYVGNYNDLIRHRYKIHSYNKAARTVDWFTDRKMIDGYKRIITHLLNRINTVNGIRYGDDHTILAFETGNELNWGDSKRIKFERAPPTKWTLEIAKHIKSLTSNILVMDGSFARKSKKGRFWDPKILDSKYVDLFSYHLYGEADLAQYDSLNKEVRAHGKTLIIGEHGFYSSPSTYSDVYEKFDCAGALIWSLRGHSEKGGFITHSEGNNIYSYHVPGWRTQTSEFFDTQEADVISATYDASYTVIGRVPPPKPVPGRPKVFFLTNGTHAGLSWRGAVWADHYEIFGAHFDGLSYNLVSNEVQDNAGPGEVFIPLDPKQPTKSLSLHRHKVKPNKSHRGWFDRKWCVPGSRCWKILEKEARAKNSTDNTTSFHSFYLNSKTAHQSSSTPSSQKYQVLPPMYPTNTLHKRTLEGGWYSVRAVNPDGVRGKRSKATFLHSHWFNFHHSER